MKELNFNSSEYYKEISDLASDLYDEALRQNGGHSGSAMDAISEALHELEAVQTGRVTIEWCGIRG